MKLQVIREYPLVIFLTLFIGTNALYAENIDPFNDDSQYAYGENVGWFNAEPSGNGGPGVEVEDTKLTGYVWAENIGWLSLSCENTTSCGTVSFGVTNDRLGGLSQAMHGAKTQAGLASLVKIRRAVPQLTTV